MLNNLLFSINSFDLFEYLIYLFLLVSTEIPTNGMYYPTYKNKTNLLLLSLSIIVIKAIPKKPIQNPQSKLK